MALLDAKGDCWRTSAGQILATIQEEGDASVLTFSWEENPFLRMLLVAGVLRR